MNETDLRAEKPGGTNEDHRMIAELAESYNAPELGLRANSEGWDSGTLLKAILDERRDSNKKRNDEHTEKTMSWASRGIAPAIIQIAGDANVQFRI